MQILLDRRHLQLDIIDYVLFIIYTSDMPFLALIQASQYERMLNSIRTIDGRFARRDDGTEYRLQSSTTIHSLLTLHRRSSVLQQEKHNIITDASMYDCQKGASKVGERHYITKVYGLRNMLINPSLLYCI